MLSKEDLYLGRHVSYREVADIVDYYIVIANTSGLYPNIEGDIVYLGDTNDKKEMFDQLLKGGFCIYKSKLDALVEEMNGQFIYSL